MSFFAWRGRPSDDETVANAVAVLQGDPPAPGLARRMAAFVYEGVLLFGVVFTAALPYSVLTHQRHAMAGRDGMMLVAFVLAPGLYCVWYWSQTGQTLPMQTWHIQVLRADGQRLSRTHSLARYLAAWLWFLPALALAWALEWQHSSLRVSLATLLWILAYALLSRLHPQRQFWHDALCGTRLVDTRPAPRSS